MFASNSAQRRKHCIHTDADSSQKTIGMDLKCQKATVGVAILREPLALLLVTSGDQQQGQCVKELKIKRGSRELPLPVWALPKSPNTANRATNSAGNHAGAAFPALLGEACLAAVDAFETPVGVNVYCSAGGRAGKG